MRDPEDGKPLEPFDPMGDCYVCHRAITGTMIVLSAGLKDPKVAHPDCHADEVKAQEAVRSHNNRQFGHD